MKIGINGVLLILSAGLCLGLTAVSRIARDKEAALMAQIAARDKTIEQLHKEVAAKREDVEYWKAKFNMVLPYIGKSIGSSVCHSSGSKDNNGCAAVLTACDVYVDTVNGKTYMYSAERQKWTEHTRRK